MTIKRYDVDPFGNGEENPSGFWVRHSDHASEVERLKTEKRELHMAVIFGAMVAADDTQELKEVIEVLAVQKAERDTLTAENAALRESNAVLQSQVDNSDVNLEQLRMIHRSNEKKLVDENAALREDRAVLIRCNQDQGDSLGRIQQLLGIELPEDLISHGEFVDMLCAEITRRDADLTAALSAQAPSK